MKRKFRPGTFWSLVVIHLLALVGIVYWFAHGFMWASWLTMATMCVLSMIGISMGYHRLLTHESFVSKLWLARLLAVKSALAIQGSAKDWTFWHSLHHAFSDREGDPHRPTEYPGLRGFLWAHCAWTWHEVLVPAGYRREPFEARFSPDKVKVEVIAWQTRHYWKFAVLGIAIPSFLVCGPVGMIAYGGAGGYLLGAFEGMFLAGFVRLVLTWHATWSVNSIAHIFGREVEERWRKVKTTARNNWFVNALGWFVGEGNHGNHHNYPKCAFLGWSRWQIDICKPLILLAEKTGQVRNVNYGPLEH